MQRVGLVAADGGMMRGTVAVQGSKNYFPLSFMVRQAAYTAGIKLERVPLPKTVLGLRLGNIMTIRTGSLFWS